MKFIFDDGGRAAAGYKGTAGDCVCRAICIASGLSYPDVYKRLAEGNAYQRPSKHCPKPRGRTAARGINVKRKWFKDYMHELGFEWTACMGIGTGCTVHLVDDELPMGRLIVSVSGHYTAVIDGVIRDIYSPERQTVYYENNVLARTSERCVYGYWRKA